MKLETAEYLEVNLIGVLLLLMMYFFIGRRGKENRSREQQHFLRMVIFNILILLADIGILCLRRHSTPALIMLNHLFCMAYYGLNTWFCYEWLCYAVGRLNPRYQFNRSEHLLFLLPSVINDLVVVLSPFTGTIYTISQDNVYHRGKFFYIPILAALIYWLLGTLIIFHEKKHPTVEREPAVYKTLLVFPLFLFAGNLLQFHFYGLSTAWIFAALAILFLYTDLQNEELSRDPLTGLYNREHINRQLLWETLHLHSSRDLLYIAMFDLDHFKSINDRYGHVAGDRALVFTAGILMKTCRKSDSPCRFGGDEFLLIGHVKKEEEMEAILNRVEDAMKQSVQEAGLPFPLTLSAGYTIYSSGDKVTIDEIVNATDNKMYEQKRKKMILK